MQSGHTLKRAIFFKGTSTLHLCNHKFVLEPCCWGMLHFCLDVDPLSVESFWHGSSSASASVGGF